MVGKGEKKKKSRWLVLSGAAALILIAAGCWVFFAKYYVPLNVWKERGEIYELRKNLEVLNKKEDGFVRKEDDYIAKTPDSTGEFVDMEKKVTNLFPMSINAPKDYPTVYKDAVNWAKDLAAGKVRKDDTINHFLTKTYVEDNQKYNVGQPIVAVKELDTFYIPDAYWGLYDVAAKEGAYQESVQVTAFWYNKDTGKTTGAYIGFKPNPGAYQNVKEE